MNIESLWIMWKLAIYVTVSYFPGIMVILNLDVSPNLQDKYFFVSSSLCLFYWGSKNYFRYKSLCAVETYANPLATGFLVSWVHIAKVYIRWSLSFFLIVNTSFQRVGEEVSKSVEPYFLHSSMQRCRDF